MGGNWINVAPEGSGDIWQWVEATPEELAEDYAKVVASNVETCKRYLAETDWITAKYNDVVTVSGSMSKADFTAKYAEIYAKRNEARNYISANS